VNRSATKLIYSGQDLQRQGGTRNEEQRVPSRGLGVGVKLGGNVAKMEVPDAESALLEAGSTAVTGSAVFPHWGGELSKSDAPPLDSTDPYGVTEAKISKMYQPGPLDVLYDREGDTERDSWYVDR
jgi:hypothetical protein